MKVRIGLGPLTGQAMIGGLSRAEELDIVMSAVREADECGFDSVWISEHHLAGDGYISSPLTLLAAVARETSHVTLATDVALAPLYQPLRLAEECALVDQLSHGRMMLGLGAGYRREEFEVLGVPFASRGRLVEHTVDELRSHWTTDVHAHDQHPVGPPVLLGGFAEAAVRRAGRIADGWIAPSMPDSERFTRRIEWLQQEHAFDKPFHVVVQVPTFIAPVGAWERVRQGMSHVEDRYRVWKSHDASPPSTAIPLLAQPPEHTIVGDTAHCAQLLAPWWKVLHDLPPTAIPHLLVKLHYPGVGEEATRQAIRQFAADVVPVLEKES